MGKEMKKLLIACLLLTGCEVKLKDSRQDVVQSGESYTYVVIRLEFIEQLRQLCQDSLLPEAYASDELYKQAIAQCTFEKMSNMSINMTTVSSFTQQYCQPTSDLSSLSQAQQAQVKSACTALGY